MTKTTYNRPPRDPFLENAILGELRISNATPFNIDELAIAISSHPGLKRSRNEDRIAVARIFSANGETYTVAIVCDGVGGSEFGDQAAINAVVSIISGLAQQQDTCPLDQLATELVITADENVRDLLQGRGTTTLVMILATANGNLVCANVGDSRAYSWDPTFAKFDQITVDDTIENELKGLIDNPDALINAHGLRGRLSQAIGEPGRSAGELRIQIYNNENFPHGAVIGSDGLWRASKDFESIVANSVSPIDAARRSIAVANWVGGVDNASIIVIGDIARLFGQNAEKDGKVQITLWTPSNKLTFVTNQLPLKAKTPQSKNKIDKPKRIQKKKITPNQIDNPQLELEKPEIKEKRNKIEVTLGDTPPEQ